VSSISELGITLAVTSKWNTLRRINNYAKERTERASIASHC
jgi:hypothetical protein